MLIIHYNVNQENFVIENFCLSKFHNFIAGLTKKFLMNNHRSCIHKAIIESDLLFFINATSDEKC